ECFETVMINCNPETVSTDYDTTDRLYFEPLKFADAMAMVEDGSSAGRSAAAVITRSPDTAPPGYDTTDRLYFEPLTFEDVMAVLEKERSAGADVACLVQFGGQTPLKLALPLQAAGVSILGTSPDSIDLAEDLQRFAGCLAGLTRP